MNLYRVKYGIRNGGTSWGDWRYYEDKTPMLADLLVASLDRAMRNERGAGYRLLSAWKRFYTKDPDSIMEYTNVFSVEKVVDGEWKEVEFVFTPPEVDLID